MKNENNPYEDILHLPRPVSPAHPPMPLSDRAAQFSPFAALTGHGAAIQEAARLTEERIELDESRQAVLGERLRLLQEKAQTQPEVSVTYFKADSRKAGGAYLTATGNLKKLDEYESALIMTDGTHIPIEDILDITAELFPDFDA